MKTIVCILMCLIALIANVFGQNGLSYLSDTIIQHNRRGLIADDNGNYIAAYLNRGVVIFSGDETILIDTSNSNLPSLEITDIELYSNKLYVATGLGVYFCSYPNGIFNWSAVPVFQNMRIPEIAFNNNKLYAFCANWEFPVDTLVVYDMGQQTRHDFTLNGFSWYSYNNPNAFANNGDIYWGAGVRGIYKLSSGQVSAVTDSLKAFNIYIDNNKLWFSTSKGLFCLNTNNNSVLPVSNFEFYDNVVDYRYALYTRDSEGNIVLALPYGNTLGKLMIQKYSNNELSSYYYPDDSISLSSIYPVMLQVGINKYLLCSSSKKIGIFDLSQYHDSVNGYSARNMKWIDINRVKAAVKSFGTLFWDGRGDPRYMVPADQRTSSIFAAGLWVGGYDDNNTLYFSGERYNQQGYDYYPGPLTVDEYGEPGTIDYPVMASFNRVWKIDRYDLGVFAYNHYNNIPYDVPADIAQWPGNGPQGCSALLAPFIDNNEDGLYNIADGDMPEIIGDQMLWWVTNDVAAPHTESGGNSMGIEVQYSLYAYVYVNPPTVYSDLVNYQTWLRIKLINRSDRNYHSVYMGLFVDGDLGNPTDDYIGSDVEHNSFYFYNGDHFDEDYMGNTGYGVNPPVQTITVLKSPLLDPNGIDDDGDGTIDNEQTGMSRFMYYNYAGGVPATTDPNSAESCYSYLTGYWLDGQPLCYGGTGHPSGGGNSEIPCNYMFPGDTDPNFNGTPAMLVGDWSEETSGNPSGDRRGVCSMGPVHLDSNEVVEIDVLFGFIPYSQQRSGKFDYTPKLDTLISWYRNGNIPSNYAAANQLPVPVHTRAPLVLVYPNPASDYVIIQTDDKMSKITLCDVGGNELTAFQPGSSFFRISCAALASGVYYLKIETAGASNVRKLVITD